MKKTIAILLATLCAIASAFMSGCKSNNELDNNVSQLRFEILVGESEGYKMTAYFEMCEFPLAADGIANTLSKVIKLKLTQTGDEGTFETKFTVAGINYTKKFEYNPIGSNYAADVFVESFPDSDFAVDIIDGEKQETVILKSVKTSGIIDHAAALETAKSEFSGKLDTLQSSKTDYEYQIRLLCENDNVFWFVGLVTSGGTNAALIDASSGKVVAKKELAA